MCVLRGATARSGGLKCAHVFRSGACRRTFRMSRVEHPQPDLCASADAREGCLELEPPFVDSGVQLVDTTEALAEPHGKNVLRVRVEKRDHSAMDERELAARPQLAVAMCAEDRGDPVDVDAFERRIGKAGGRGKNRELTGEGVQVDHATSSAPRSRVETDDSNSRSPT